MKVEIYTFVRTGTHLLAWLVARNFLKMDNYIPLIKNHAMIPESRIRDDVKYLYPIRNFEDTVQSIYDMRCRFGLDEDDFEKFKTRKIKDMFNENIKSEVTWDTDSESGDKMISNVGDAATKVSMYFQGIDMTLREYYDVHKNYYLDLATRHPNIYFVSFDRLLSDFQDEMFKLYCFLNDKTPALTEKPEFEMAPRIVGWNTKK